MQHCRPGFLQPTLRLPTSSKRAASFVYSSHSANTTASWAMEFCAHLPIRDSSAALRAASASGLSQKPACSIASTALMKAVTNAACVG